ncbi:sigma-70 family RNA polymerase sigma factor [Bythopirellula polymerisocia]|uniref:ECF RNA polymerase sigma factor SigW n=1 Tax=Bythopirellula polymerisocia TaxID=2528003 RepID=A0A5C6CZG6_9BACT|nr:sigma-70 family RNA polymerase sigma factor [Bythopirellula polymerisocia]TWU30032.1 ECF RNA polymerase sigma factor SigW [Bythopirellula polymerisocia]
MTPDVDNLRDFSEQLLNGDREALAKLLALHRQRLWRIVHLRLDPCMAGRVDPDDILQEAYIAASLRLVHYSEQRHFSPFVWLRMIVGQTLIDVHRRHVGAQQRDARRETVKQDYAVSLASFHLASARQRRTSPSHAVLRSERNSMLHAAIESLKPSDQEVLELRHFEELTNNEVAEVLGIEPKAASIRYVRAITRLREVAAATPGLSEVLTQ